MLKWSSCFLRRREPAPSWCRHKNAYSLPFKFWEIGDAPNVYWNIWLSFDNIFELWIFPFQSEFNLEEKLLQLYIEESLKDSAATVSPPLPHNSSPTPPSSSSSSLHLNPCSNLLSRLCKRELYNRLVLALHPGNEGYSILLGNHIKCRL